MHFSSKTREIVRNVDVNIHGIKKSLWNMFIKFKLTGGGHFKCVKLTVASNFHHHRYTD